MSVNLRHNVAALGADYALFVVGLAFASQSTILPAFAAYLGAPNVVIGAIPAVMTLGWFMPSLFAAGHTETLERKLPFLVRYTVWERVPFIVLALAAFFLADRAPALTLGVMLLMLLIVTGVGGALMPAWMDLIGRVVPVTLRGRFFGFANLAASAGGLVASVVTASILATISAPASYGLCFVCTSVCLGLSFAALVVVREPASTSSAPAVPLREYLARIRALLGRDPNLAWFLAARAFGVVGTIGNGFYTVYALRAWDAPVAQVGVFTTLLFVGQMVGNAALGWLADRRGHRLVIILGFGATLTGNVVAIAAPTLGAIGMVFVMMGIQIAAMNVSNLNVMLEFAPEASAQPTYVGLGTTLPAPVAFVAPLAAGLLADVLGFAAVFSTAALAGGVALGLLIARVRDPRALAAARAA